MYGNRAVAAYLDLVRRPDAAKWQQTQERWHIEWTILPPFVALASFLDEQPGWRRIYADDWAVVHVRDTKWPEIRSGR